MCSGEGMTGGRPKRVAARWAKCTAKAAMSSCRSRSGGKWMGNTATRYQRSSRNLPSVTMAARSRCVAATIRTSTLIGLCPPTRSSQPSWRILSRRTWAAKGSSPSSSKSRVPPWARSNQPWRVSTAPVKAPRSWPKSCESMSSLGMAPQLTRMNGPALRGERLWMSRATSSLPVPVSPMISTGASDRATSSTRSMTVRSPESEPTTVSVRPRRPSRLSRERLSASAASRRAAISRSR